VIQLGDIPILEGPVAIYRPPPRQDLLRLPLLGRLLRAKRGRLWLQLPVFLLAALLIYDGFTGSNLAPQNVATVGVWIHYRGLVMLALLLVGNLFCMGCPFTIPRTVAQRWSGRGRRWPRALRNKWLAVIAFAGFLFLYEWFDLWTSPALTAWLIAGYFAGAFILEALFAKSPFCKYVCPLGTFNFVAGTVSPSQITVRDRDVCRACPGKECVNGSPRALGCGMELFPPTLLSNLDSLTWLGTEPDWTPGLILPGGWILALQTAIVLIGFAGSLFVGQRIDRRDFASPAAVRALLPWLIVLLAMAATALWLFNLPMEMRGTMFPGG
jgi:polyferredoxin